MGIQGHRVQKDGDLEVWSKQLADGGRAVVLLNRGDKPATISADWREIGYPAKLPADVRDLWAHKDLARHTGNFSAEVPANASVMVRITP
jgi:alpha-galactosidase